VSPAGRSHAPSRRTGRLVCPNCLEVGHVGAVRAGVSVRVVGAERAFFVPAARNPGVNVEPATADDVDAVADLWTALADGQREYGSHVRPSDSRTAARETLARRAAIGRLLVAREDGIVGFASVEVERGRYALDVPRGVVTALYVVPSARDRGVGRKLLAAAESTLRSAGAETVSLQAMAANADARRFYRRNGYEPHRIEFEKRVAPRSDSDTKEA